METIQITLTEDQIRSGIEKSINDALKESYRNPIKEAVEKAIKENEGAIKKVVDEIIVNAVTNPEFKAKMSDIVLQRLVESALRKS
jgi:uncharacterized protein YllA (UPF0747 family)